MAKKTKAATKRTKVKDIPKSKREMIGRDMRKVKGGDATVQPTKQRFADVPPCNPAPVGKISGYKIGS